MPDENSEDHRHDCLAQRRTLNMDIPGMQRQLEALDREHKGAHPQLAPHEFDLSAARDAIAAMQERIDARHPGHEVARAVNKRAEALQALRQQLAAKLNAAGQPQVIAQGLRSLEKALYAEADFPLPGAADETLINHMEQFDRAYGELQARARELLKDRVGLALMPDQTGTDIQPRKHDVVGSQPAPDPADVDTVAAQQAPGWLLDDDVLVRADVVRYSAGAKAAPGLPDPRQLDDEGDLDEDIIGHRK